MHRTILKARSSESVESDGQEKCYLFVIDVRRHFFITGTLISHLCIIIISHLCIIIDTFKMHNEFRDSIGTDAHKLSNNFHNNNFIIYNIQSLIRTWTLNRVHEFNENHCHR